MISILFMLIFIRPLLGFIDSHSEYRFAMAYMYLAICVFPALVIFYFDQKIIISSDELKLRARGNIRGY